MYYRVFYCIVSSSSGCLIFRMKIVYIARYHKYCLHPICCNVGWKTDHLCSYPYIFCLRHESTSKQSTKIVLLNDLMLLYYLLHINRKQFVGNSTFNICAVGCGPTIINIWNYFCHNIKPLTTTYRTRGQNELVFS